MLGERSKSANLNVLQSYVEDVGQKDNESIFGIFCGGGGDV